MKTLYNRYRFFHEHAGYVVGRSAECALALARAEERAEREGLAVTWEDECDSWEDINGTDCAPAPPIHVQAFVKFEGRIVTSLGSIGLNSWRDPYVRVVEAELFSGALAEIDNERNRAASEIAAELDSRATFAAC